MKDVRATLALAFEKLHAIASTYDLKSDVLDQDTLNKLIIDLGEVDEQVEEATRRVAGHIVTTLYAIGKETAPGEYEGFTHGPVEDRDDLTNQGEFEDGDALVRIQTGGGVVNYLTESIWLDGEWNATEDDTPKEATA